MRNDDPRFHENSPLHDPLENACSLSTLGAEVCQEILPRLEALIEARMNEIASSIAETYLSEKRVAERLDLSVKTLQLWRQEHEGPRYVRFGARSVRYPLSKLIEYEKAELARTEEPNF